MYYYKFRVHFDEVDDFVRDIEILATDNFESFHNILYTSIGLTGNELAAFSICDSKWNKTKEITLIDMFDDQEAQSPEYDDEDDFSTQSNIPKFVMKNSLLKDFITDPHQQLIYEYDFLNPRIFYIELLKTLEVREKVNYPRCTNSVKELPKQMEKMILPNLEGDFMIDETYNDEENMDDYDDDYLADNFSDLDNIDEY